MNDRTCSIDGCSTRVKARGLCSRHYYRASVDGTLEQYARRFVPVTGDCSTLGCDRPAEVKGMCSRHYANLHRYGYDIPIKDRTLEFRLERTGWTVVQRREDMTPCWEWGGSRTAYGYGTLSFRGRAHRAHRAMYQVQVSDDLDSDTVVRHKCDNPPCVNPEHLEAGTKADNTNDMVERARTGRQYENTDWKCGNGHDVSTPGSYKIVTQRGKKPYRACVTCARTRSREYMRKKRARLSGQA